MTPIEEVVTEDKATQDKLSKVDKEIDAIMTYQHPTKEMVQEQEQPIEEPKRVVAVAKEEASPSTEDYGKETIQPNIIKILDDPILQATLNEAHTNFHDYS